MLYPNYEIHTNVSGITDVVAKLRAFAVAAGWTESGFRSGERYEQFEEPYGFQGTPDSYYSFFHLSSPGWGGAQNLIFQFMLHNFHQSVSTYNPRGGVAGHDPTDYALGLGAVKNTTYDATGNRYAPWHQDSNNSFEACGSYQTGTGGIRITHDLAIPKMYLFGDDKFIWMAITHDNFYHQHFCFGSVVPLDATMPIDGNLILRCFSPINNSASTTCYPWEVYRTFAAPYSTKPYTSLFFYEQGTTTQQSAGKIVWGDEHLDPVYENHYWTKGSDHSGSELSYPNFEDLKISRTIGGRYHLMKTVYSVMRPADSYIQPFATTPFYSCNCVGETPGTILEYGNDKFLILPDGTLESDRWFAIRIQ